MSLFTDIRDLATAPFRAVGTFVDDITSGKNAFDSTGKFVGNEVAAATGGFTLQAKSPLAQDVLKAASPVTFGVSGNFARGSDEYNKIISGNFSKGSFIEGTEQLGRAGAIVGGSLVGGSAIAGAGASGTTLAGSSYLAGGAASKLLKGDLSGAVSTFSPDAGSALSTAKDFFSPVLEPSKVSQGEKTPPPQVYGGAIAPSVSQVGDSKLPLILAASVIGFILYRKFKK